MEAVVGIFLASLAGSPHCAAMCGPFLAFAAAGADPSSPKGGIVGAYQLGRAVSYLTLGAMAGALGAGVERLGAVAGVSRLAAIVAGMAMIAWGVDTILVTRGYRSRLHAPATLQHALSRVTSRLTRLPGVGRSAVIGAATALLPCGFLYAFVAAAGGMGSPVRGMLVMSVFWAGTLPVMTTLGLGVQRLAGPLRRSLPVVTASVVVAIGLLTIAGRLRPSLGPGSASAHSHAAQR
ncbi:MAG TPA: sulfite exporter TauE/SafE family protein [Gemmatimonadaceae bacterium]